MQALARASAQNSREYFRNQYCLFQVLRAYSQRCWYYLDIPVIGNMVASLIGSSVIKFLVVIATVGGLVISPLLLMLQVTKQG